jgi:hypothetical protein
MPYVSAQFNGSEVSFPIDDDSMSKTNYVVLHIKTGYFGYQYIDHYEFR